MISVTAAAHTFRRSSRSMGTHLKAFGSGRVALGSVDEDSDTHEQSRYFITKQPDPPKSTIFTSVKRIIFKFLHVFLRFINSMCPLVSYMVDVKAWSEPAVTNKNANREPNNTVFDCLDDKLLLKILKFCDAKSILSLEASCCRLRLIIQKNCDELAKVQKDQIKLHFDEGEVIVFSMDERVVPNRFPMPSIEHLGKHLRHLSTLSLFIRGIIPIESIPVLKRLSRHELSTSQIYFLWCEFDHESAEHLKQLFLLNSKTLSDIGFEICSPTNMISDALIQQNLPKLVSLRVWHDENATNTYAISDQTLFRLADLFKSKSSSPLETLDIIGGNFTVNGVCALIEAWYWQSNPKNDIYISLHNCNFTQSDVVNNCYGIPLSFKHGLENRGHRLNLNID